VHEGVKTIEKNTKTSYFQIPFLRLPL